MEGPSVLRVVQYNCRRSAAALQNLTVRLRYPEILCIQEPPFTKIGLARSSNDPLGTPVYGLPTLSDYASLLPPHASVDKPPHVCFYIALSLPLSSYSLLSPLSQDIDIISLHFKSADFTFVLTNVYNPARSESPNTHVQHRLDDETLYPHDPWIVLGDFNRHHQKWSCREITTAEQSPGQVLLTWFEEAGLEVITPHKPTRKASRPGDRDSTIDLCAVSGHLTDLCLSDDCIFEWNDDLSDHTAISWKIPLTRPVKEPKPPTHCEPDSSQKDAWLKALKEPLTKAFTHPTTHSINLDEQVQLITSAFQTANQSVYHVPTHKEHTLVTPKWWDASCRAHQRALTEATGLERTRIQQMTRKVHRSAKAQYFSNLVENCNPDTIWRFAKWNQGVRRTPVATLQKEGVTAVSNKDKADLFKEHYFGAPQTVYTPPTTTYPPESLHIALTREEVSSALKSTNSTSAPGLSGITFKTLKWVYPHYQDQFLHLFQQCLALGHQPKTWRSARIFMLRKTNKPDPTKLNAYRPITLEEAMAKWLERIVSNRLQYFCNTGWLPKSQYGGRQLSGVYDAALSLVEEVHQAWQKKQVVSALACDVSGFFPSVSHALLLHVLRSKGCPTPLTSWIASFLSSRSVAISFDGFTAPVVNIANHGIPQGSPISPILAEICASGIFAERLPRHCTLRAYVDDHLITAVGPDTATTCFLLQEAYEVLDSYFSQRGLALDADKTELIHFTRQHKISERDRARSITLSPTLQIKPKSPLRWLGIYFDTRLLFNDHVRIQRNRASSAFHALRILSNTQKGLSAIHMRRIYIACVRPLLTWGAPIWYTGHRDISRVRMLEGVQSKAVRHILGAFRSSPTWATHHLASILPLHIYLDKQKDLAAARLLTLGYKGLRRTDQTPRRKYTALRDWFGRLPNGTCESLPSTRPPPWRSLETSGFSFNVHAASSSSVEQQRNTKHTIQSQIREFAHDPSVLIVFTTGVRVGNEMDHLRSATGMSLFKGGNNSSFYWPTGTFVTELDLEQLVIRQAATYLHGHAIDASITRIIWY
ncbi:MAG: hypothetical protein QOH32_4996, partial [Bradyrhizobium sp.]|nr:hypothetical protein [Bradyrhizobium sp.]